MAFEQCRVNFNWNIIAELGRGGGWIRGNAIFNVKLTGHATNSFGLKQISAHY